jgi:hypothetical protein
MEEQERAAIAELDLQYRETENEAMETVITAAPESCRRTGTTNERQLSNHRQDLVGYLSRLIQNDNHNRMLLHPRRYRYRCHRHHHSVTNKTIRT